MSRSVKRWPVDYHIRSDGVPLQLDRMRKVLPGINRTKVDGLVLHLKHSARELWPSPPPVVTFAVVVIEGQLPDGAEAILKR